MSIEYSDRRRGENPFPRHWHLIQAGQDSETRAAMIVTHMALDAEARGDTAAAEEIRQAFITGGRSNSHRSMQDAQDAWVRNPTAQNALRYAQLLGDRK